MAKILVIGSINMDLVVRVPHTPMPGETVLGGNFETFPGGKGANQAVAAARLEGDVTMVGRVGSDDFGQTLLQGLVADRVGTTQVRQDPQAPSGIAMIAVAEDGENIIVVASGANMQVSAEDVRQARDLMCAADVLLLQLEIPLDTVTAAIDLAKECGLPVILNPAPAQPLPPSLFKHIDTITPNENELAVLTGETNLEQGIQRLQTWGVNNIVVTLGSAGAHLVTNTIDHHFPAFPITAVDTTAAGDAFTGALAVGLAEGLPILEAVRFACAAGALAATQPGAQPSLPTRAAVMAFLAKHEG